MTLGYIILLIYVIIIRLLFGQMKQKNSFAELNAYFIGIFVFVGLRSLSTGTDTYGYCMSFLRNGILTYGELMSQGLEVGYLWFGKTIYMVAPFPQALLVMQGLIVSLAYRKFISRFSEDYFLSVLVFMAFGLLSFHITGIRQSIAMAICVYAYIYAMDKKTLYFILLNAIAILFHASAFVFLISYFVIVYWKKLMNPITIGFIGIVMILFIDRVNLFVASTYSRWEQYSDLASTGNGYIFFAVIALITIFAEIQRRSLPAETRAHMRVNYMNFLFWLGRLSTRTFERPSLYFMPSIMALLPDTINTIKDKRMRTIVYIASIILICLLYLYRYTTAEYALFFMPQI